VSSTVDVRAATEVTVPTRPAVVPGAGRDHVRGNDPVTAPPGQGQQAPQLGLLGPAEPGLAQLRPQPDDLALQPGDLLL
jgi:hypothetical protein